MKGDWLYRFDASVTLCDKEGKVVYMNEKSRSSTYAADGGEKLIGQKMFDCHPEPARTKVREMLERQQTNCYTIEKDGNKKLLYQAPWYDESGQFAGIVELALPIPCEMPHYNRDLKK